jgi:hypothetical protein
VLVQFSDEQLSKRLISDQACVGKQLLSTRKTTLFMDPAATLIPLDGGNDSNDATKELYRPGCVVLATPFFQYHSTGSIGFTHDAAKIVGYLEVVIQPENHPTITAPQTTENDVCILELTTQVLGRYLNFHYDEFFVVQSSFQAEPIQASSSETGAAEGIDLTQVFPSPDLTPANDQRHLVVSINALQVLVTEPLVSLEVQIQLGGTSLCRQSIPFGDRPASPTSREKSDPEAQQRWLALADARAQQVRRRGCLDWFTSVRFRPHAAHG